MSISSENSSTSNTSSTSRNNTELNKKPEKNANYINNDNVPASLGPPFTPRRIKLPSRLSLQMPSRGPLSPVLDPTLGYSVARRPRLEFARACTSLHHSTLAESSPDSSPLAFNAGYPIPRNSLTRPLDSPININHSCNHTSSHASSLGSTSILDYPSGDDSDSSNDDDFFNDLDFVDAVTPSSAVVNPPFHESAASISLLNHQKARMGARAASRRASSSSRNRPMMTPSPVMRPISQVSIMSGGDYPPRKREALSLGPSALDLEPVRSDPVRRPVSRCSSLLPKTKNFQRIKAALIEELSPVDMEAKREAEITRQIREDDEPAPSPKTANSVSREPDISEEDSSGDSICQTESLDTGISFSKQAERHGGFWFGEQMDGLSGSPPQFPNLRMGSDGDIIMNSDSCLNSPVAAIPSDLRRLKRRRTLDERFEPNLFKRRAVSPGLSNSPKLAQSPPTHGGNGGGKRLNFQGFSDTSDGLMNMTLHQ